MKKLYALESDLNSDENDLLIDKVLNYSEKKNSALSVTANIIKQRQNLKKEIQKKLNENEEENNEDKETSDDFSDNIENKEENLNNENKNTKNAKENLLDENSKEKSKDKEVEDKDTENKDTEEDKSKNSSDLDNSEADSKESLKSIIGSGLKKNSEENVAKESYSSKTSLKLKNIFNPIKNRYNRYLISLESFNLPFKLAIEQQPIVYIKDSVLESLNNLIQIANIYIDKNKEFVHNNSKSVKSINEKLTIIRELIKNEKYHFNYKLINDSNLLSNLSIENSSNLRETYKYLINYINNSNSLINLILNNKFEDIEECFTNSDFIFKNNDFVYKNTLPGFNVIKAHLEKYTNYLKINIEEFHYYKLRVFKTENLYNLEAISITEDKELNYLIDVLDKLLIELSLTIDNFNILNNNLNKFIDEIKVIAYDVENNKYTNLADMNIDDKIKDFIKFKIISEIYYINTELLLNFILNNISVVYNCIEFKT